MDKDYSRYEEKLSAYLDGLLPPQEAAEIAERLKADRGLADMLEKMRRLKELAGDFDPRFDTHTRDSLHARIMAAVEESERKGRIDKGRIIPVWQKYVAAAASIAILFLAGRVAIEELKSPSVTPGKKPSPQTKVYAPSLPSADEVVLDSSGGAAPAKIDSSRIVPMEHPSAAVTERRDTPIVKDEVPVRIGIPVPSEHQQVPQPLAKPVIEESRTVPIELPDIDEKQKADQRNNAAAPADSEGYQIKIISTEFYTAESLQAEKPTSRLPEIDSLLAMLDQKTRQEQVLHIRGGRASADNRLIESDKGVALPVRSSLQEFIDSLKATAPPNDTASMILERFILAWEKYQTGLNTDDLETKNTAVSAREELLDFLREINRGWPPDSRLDGYIREAEAWLVE